MAAISSCIAVWTFLFSVARASSWDFYWQFLLIISAPPALCYLLWLHPQPRKKAAWGRGRYAVALLVGLWVAVCFWLFSPVHIWWWTLVDWIIPYHEHPARRAIEVVSHPPNSTVDIYAVHGLGSSPEHAWTYMNGDEKLQFRWLQELLPEIDDLRLARVATITHQTRWDADAAVMTFEQHASKMLRAITHDRESREKRPIIIIAHSFGGLLVKQMLSSPDILGNEVFDMTKAILFLGVPHGGSPLAWLSIVFSYSAYWRGASASLLELMLPGTRRAEELRDTFQNVFVKGHWDSPVRPYICDFYEQRAERFGSLAVGVTAVPDSGHVLGEKEMLDTDHRGLAKFRSQQDPNFETFLIHLRRAMKRASNQREYVSTFQGRKGASARTALTRDSLVERYPPASSANEFAISYTFPHQRHGHMIGREEILSKIRQLVLGGATPSSRRIGVLHGLGGAGKTRIAFEYAARHAEDYDSVFYIRAPDYDTAYRAFRAVGDHILHHYARRKVFNTNHDQLAAALQRDAPADAYGASARPQPDWEAEIEAIKTWFAAEGNTNWLMIFDEVDDIESFLIEHFFPRGSTGHILLTSRRKDLSTIGEGIHVGDLNEEEGLRLLTSLAHFDEELSGSDREKAVELLQLLSYFPLAIVQACAYLVPHYPRTHPSHAIRSYLELYRANARAILQERPQPSLFDYREETVFTTWEINFSAIQKRDPQAANILLCAGFLSGQELSEEIFQIGLGMSPRDLSLKRSFRLLSSYFMIDYNSAVDFSMHPLVHFWAKERLDIAAQKKVAAQVLLLISQALHVMRNRASGRERLSVSSRLMRHLNESITNVQRFHFPEHFLGSTDETTQTPNTNHSGVGHFRQLSASFLGRMWWELYTMICTKLEFEWWTAGSPIDLLKSVNSQSPRYKELLLYWDNEQICTWTFQGAYDRLPRGHPLVLRLASRLGDAMYLRGDSRGALQWYEQVLEALRSTLGVSHPLTVETMIGMAAVLRSLGRHDEALDTLQSARRAVDDEHVQDGLLTAQTMTAIGLTHAARGEFDEAIGCYQRAMSIRAGSNPDETAVRYEILNIARAFHLRRQHDQALTFYQQALATFEQAREGDHPRAVEIIYHIASIHLERDELSKAREWYSRIPQVTDGKALVEADRSAGTGLSLREDQVAQCRPTPAEDPSDWCVRALQGLQDVSMPYHPSTFAVYSQIGVLFEKMGQPTTALKWFREVLTRRELVLGPTHPQTLQSITQIAACHNVIGETDEALAWLNMELSRRLAVSGLADPGIPLALWNIGSCLANMGRLEEATEYFAQARAGQERLGRYQSDFTPVDGASPRLSPDETLIESAMAAPEKP